MRRLLAVAIGGCAALVAVQTAAGGAFPELVATTVDTAIDTAWWAVESGDTGWWSAPGPGWDTGCDSGDTGQWWCGATGDDDDDKLGVVDLTNYPKDQNYADIPKDVADIVSVHCTKCHASTRGRKQTPLDKYDRDLGSFPWKGVKPKEVLEQMKDRINRADDAEGKMPKVPPGKKLTDDQKTKVNAWLDERIKALPK